MSELWNKAPTTIKAYLGVGIVGFLVGIYGTLTAADEVKNEVNADPALAGKVPAETVDAVATGLVGFAAFVQVLGALLGLFFFYKMLQGRKWAWIVLLVFAVIGLLSALTGLADPSAVALLSLVLAAAALALLVLTPTRNHVNQATAGGFGEPPYPNQGFGEQPPTNDWNNPPR